MVSFSFLKSLPLLRLTLFWIISEGLLAISPSAVAVSETGNLLPPSSAHWLGTTPLGNDVLLYLLTGLVQAMRFASLSLTLSVLLGLWIGMISAYQGGWLDNLLGRLMDAINALPFFYIMLTVAHFWALDWITLAISFSLLGGWLPLAWHTREQTLAVKNQDFIWALRAMGASMPYILGRTLLPYNLSLLRPVLALRFNYLLLSLTTLDFLGISPRPFDAASLGQLMSWGAVNLESWWLWAPSVLIVAWITWELSQISGRNSSPDRSKTMWN